MLKCVPHGGPVDSYDGGPLLGRERRRGGVKAECDGKLTWPNAVGRAEDDTAQDIAGRFGCSDEFVIGVGILLLTRLATTRWNAAAVARARAEALP